MNLQIPMTVETIIRTLFQIKNIYNWDWKQKTSIPSEYCILALIETIVSSGEQLSSKAVPVKVSMKSSILLSAIAHVYQIKGTHIYHTHKFFSNCTSTCIKCNKLSWINLKIIIFTSTQGKYPVNSITFIRQSQTIIQGNILNSKI